MTSAVGFTRRQRWRGYSLRIFRLLGRNLVTFGSVLIHICARTYCFLRLCAPQIRRSPLSKAYLSLGVYCAPCSALMVFGFFLTIFENFLLLPLASRTFLRTLRRFVVARAICRVLLVVATAALLYVFI